MLKILSVRNQENRVLLVETETTERFGPVQITWVLDMNMVGATLRHGSIKGKRLQRKPTQDELAALTAAYEQHKAGLAPR